jgi:DHA1 family inner membrane transport protein
MRKHRLVAYGTGGFGLAANSMVQFLLPLRSVELGIGIGVIGLLLGVKALTEAVVSVPLGRLIDRVGTRRAFLAGTAAAGCVALGYTVATSIIALCLLQIALGLSRPLAWVAAQSHVSGMRDGAERAYDTGKMSFVANVGQIVGPLLVGIVAHAVDLRVAFLVLAGHSVLFFLVGLALPNLAATPTAVSDKGSSVRDARRMLTLPRMQVSMLLTFVRLWIPTAWTSFFPIYLVHEAGQSEAVAGTVVSAMAVMATLVSAFAGRIAKLGSAERVTAAALAIAAVGLGVAPFSAHGPAVYLSAVLVGVGHGVSLPMLIVLVSEAAPPGQRGLALGLRSSINQAASTLAPTVVAPLIGVTGLVVGFPIAGGIAAVVTMTAVIVAHARVGSTTDKSAREEDD